MHNIPLLSSSRLRAHCAKFGRVRRVVVYDKHPEGVAQVFFSSPEEADAAISMMDGRLFSNGRVMKANTWDGQKYKKEETAEEEEERLKQWDKYLEEDDPEEEEKKEEDK